MFQASKWIASSITAGVSFASYSHYKSNLAPKQNKAQKPNPIVSFDHIVSTIVAVGSKFAHSARNALVHADEFMLGSIGDFYAAIGEDLDAFSDSADDLLEQTRIELGAPGFTAAVYFDPSVRMQRAASEMLERTLPYHADHANVMAVVKNSNAIDGSVVWEGACGLADVELNVLMTPEMKIRIASISKSMTSVLAAKLKEDGIVDFDMPLGSYRNLKDLWKSTLQVDRAVQEAILEAEQNLHEEDLKRWGYREMHLNASRLEPKWPNLIHASTVDVSKSLVSFPYRYSTQFWLPIPKEATFPPQWDHVTLRKLLSHVGGVRHYVRDEFASSASTLSTASALLPFIYDLPIEGESKQSGSALDVGRTHPFFYTTHGYTLASFMIESAYASAFPSSMQNPRQINNVSKKPAQYRVPLPFPAIIHNHLFVPLSMIDTQLEPAYSLVYNRAKHYNRLTLPRPCSSYLPPDAPVAPSGLLPAPFVDLAGKAAGGGFISTAADVARFGGALVGTNSFLKPESLLELWSPLGRPDLKSSLAYGLGWRIHKPDPRFNGRIVGHSGAGAGSSSYLLVLPDEGITVAILANQSDCNLSNLSLDIASRFKELVVPK